MEFVFTQDDIRQMEAMGISEEEALRQIALFEKGVPFHSIDRACTRGDGITEIRESDFDELFALHESAALEGRCIKFVPASGAASRMFERLIGIYHRHPEIHRHQIESLAATDKTYRDFLLWMDRIGALAFYGELKKNMTAHGLDCDRLLKDGHFKTILKHILYSPGLNYANLPKALLQFHQYPDHARTALEEHLTEAVAYTQDRDNVASIHFTISPQHEEPIQLLLAKVLRRYEKANVLFDISFSFQKPSTDTIAVDMFNKPLRDKEGKLVFRPAGHGALLPNLEELEGDIVFIKNIDNVVPDHLKEPTVRYKKLLAGYLIKLQKRVFLYLSRLDGGIPSESAIREIMEFMTQNLSIVIPQGFERWPFDKKIHWIKMKLNRPIRVCGMVKNEGEPGGGPFWVKHADGTVSLQIVETSQIDLQAPEQNTILQSAQFFNPVDLVCGVRDYKGNVFQLKKFIDPDAAFIAKKSKDGIALKALELPGLWNGSMADWITVFVEVPPATFNPVKTVFDLLRKEHQPQPGV